MKLVPLLLAEWMSLYPSTTETVKSFLVRIRFLKSNKEMIKLRLGQHNLLPKMSQQPNQVNVDKRKNSLVLPNAGGHSVTGCLNKHRNSVTSFISSSIHIENAWSWDFQIVTIFVFSKSLLIVETANQKPRNFKMLAHNQCKNSHWSEPSMDIQKRRSSRKSKLQTVDTDIQ